MNNKISLIILAGGQGQRFNNRDKGLIEWHGRPLISHVIDKVRPYGTQLIISCNRHIEQYQSFGHFTCTDQLDNFQGPLAGIHAALPFAKHSLCLVSPCDTPNLPANLVPRLQAALDQHSADIAYPSCNGRQHYLPALIKTALFDSLSDYLQNSGRSVNGWYKTLSTVTVVFDNTEEASFTNINSAQTLKSAGL